MSCRPSDQQLKQAINGIFDKYDTDRSGTLEVGEIEKLITDVFKSLGKAKNANQDDVSNFVAAIDRNGDGKIAKEEFFSVLKSFISAN